MWALAGKPWYVAIAAIVLVIGGLSISSFVRSGDRALLCSFSAATNPGVRFSAPAGGAPVERAQLTETILHYATSGITPQQSWAEINITLTVLRERAPCNFLVFGLGFDSLMWSAFNAGGKTLFLEEDPKWVDTVLKGDKSHFLRAHTVKYPTQLQQSNELLRSYKSEPGCLPPKTFLKGNRRCRLALPDLPQEVYETEWDLVMVDAPKGYFNEAPGRMGAIYSAAVMARNRKGKGLTDVFLHDVNRPVERTYATEFLCKKNLVDGTGRLWHFRIPPVRDEGAEATKSFC